VERRPYNNTLNIADSRLLWRQNKVETVALLREGTITGYRMIPTGSNAVLLLSLVKNDRKTWAVYKPKIGETPLWDFPDGTLYKRELAAFLVSEALGWSIVPPTVIREGPYGVGVVQWFVNWKRGNGFQALVDKYPEDFKKIAVFDYLINNADRKVGHCLCDEDGRIRGIDHGLTFHAEPKLRTVIWNFAGQGVPERILGDLRSFHMVHSGNGSFYAKLSNLLAVNEIWALKARLKAILKRPIFPAWSGSYRSIPWPPY
jgi:hypothetical protein